MTIGEKIKQLRSQKGLTVRALAEKAGLCVTTVSHIETGQVQASSITIAKLAKALEVEYNELAN